jgi:hypothetical protein
MLLSKSISLLLWSAAAFANQITYTMEPTRLDVGGSNVITAAEVLMSFYTNHVVFTIGNDEADAASVGQALTGFTFQLRNPTALAGAPWMISSSAREVMVDDNGTPTFGALVDTGWNLTALVLGRQLSGATVSALGGGPPDHAILGDTINGRYSSANSSIAGNDPHNPFLYRKATFDIAIPGLTPNSQIAAMTFYFGTGGTPVDVSFTEAVPEPDTLTLAACGAMLLSAGLVLRRIRARR